MRKPTFPCLLEVVLQVLPRSPPGKVADVYPPCYPYNAACEADTEGIML